MKALLSTDQPGLDISESTGIISAQWANELEMVNLFSRSPYLMDEVKVTF